MLHQHFYRSVPRRQLSRFQIPRFPVVQRREGPSEQVRAELKIPRNDTGVGREKADFANPSPQCRGRERRWFSPFVVLQGIEKTIAGVWSSPELGLEVHFRGCNRSGIELLLGCATPFSREIGGVSSSKQYRSPQFSWQSSEARRPLQTRVRTIA